jgi:predicted transposase/invertase (TIGR01784 family)
MADEWLDEIEVPKILPPSDDGVFKTLLTHPDAKSCLRDVISSNIGLPVREVTVRNAEFPISDVKEKRERFDVSCAIDGGDQVEVEMQADPMKGDNLTDGHRNIRSRAIYNACDLHSSQDGAGVSYGRLVRTYQITFCGYTVFDNRGDCFNRFSFRNKEGEELLDAVSIIFVELSKLNRVMRKPVAAMTSAEMWAVFLAHANKPKHKALVDEIIAARGEIKMAYDLLTGISMNADERARFRAKRKFEMDLRHGMIVSFEEGEIKGKLEGISEGISEGKLETAKNMLKGGLPSDQIVRFTGLTLEQVEKLNVDG